MDRATRSHFWKPILIVGAAFGAMQLLPGIPGYSSSTQTGEPTASAPALPVPIATAVRTTVPIFYDYPGRTEAIKSISLRSRVTGHVLEQVVADGTDVAEGTLLYRLDSRDVRARLDQARAQSRRSEAALAYAKARLARAEQLIKSGSLTREEFDERTRAADDTAAGLLADQAAIRAAELELSHTEIRAPFAGRVGVNEAAIGALITAGTDPLNSLVQISPIYVTFTPSETDLATVQEAIANGTARTEVTVPGREAIHAGTLTFLNNSIDSSTGAILARTTLKNDDNRLLPGQYVRVRLIVGEKPDAFLLPEVALGSSQLGRFVYVIGEGNKAEVRAVEIGPRIGDQIAVTKGLKENDRVITGNLQRVSPGTVVSPVSLPSPSDRKTKPLEDPGDDAVAARLKPSRLGEAGRPYDRSNS